VKTRAIIVDIDGTLANVEHRRVYLDKTPKDWKAYNSAMAADTLNEWCRDLIHAVHMECGYDIIYVTGRHEEFREVTEKWLKDQDTSTGELWMRPDGDYRQDTIVKKEIYEKNIKPRYDGKIKFVIDDRKQVVDMWRSLGLVCLQCADGNF
jgi:uncharacterized HAD superfamily protein